MLASVNVALVAMLAVGDHTHPRTAKRRAAPKHPAPRADDCAWLRALC